MDQIIDEATRIAMESTLEGRFEDMLDVVMIKGEGGLTFTRFDRWTDGAEKVGRWNQPGGVGNTVPDPKAKHGGYVWQPGSDVGGLLTAFPVPLSAGVTEDNYYFMARLDDPQFLPRYIVDDREFIVTDWGTWQGIEWQWQLQGWGQRWNGAYQIGKTNGVRVWDMSLRNGDGGWVAAQLPGSVSIVPMPDPSQQKVVRVTGLFGLTHTISKHMGITINRIQYPVNYTQAPQPSPNTKFTAAVQIDPLMKVMTGKNSCAVAMKANLWAVY